MILKKKDCIVIFAGSNDFNRKLGSHVADTLLLQLEECFRSFNHTNVIIATLPYSYDLFEDSEWDSQIKQINFQIRSLAEFQNNTEIIDLYLLERKYYTGHGLHFYRS